MFLTIFLEMIQIFQRLQYKMYCAVHYKPPHGDSLHHLFISPTFNQTLLLGVILPTDEQLH